jgi:LacI family transcriptional regulator
MTRSSPRTRITDVARLSGVSLSTVSRAMNGNPSVDPALVARVKAAAAELGYTANPVARSLVLGRTQTVAVIVPDLENPTFQAILRGLSHAAAADDHHVLIADSVEDLDSERALARATRLRTDGLVLCSPRMPEDELRALLVDVSPAVVINREELPDTPVIAADYGAALGEQIDHLRALGHTRLAYLAGNTRSASHRARVDAIARARDADPGIRILEIPTGVDFESGRAAADAVVDSQVTAVLAFNDLVAMGLLTALADRGIPVPGAVSVVGFDDIPFAAHSHPPLTTAAVPAHELGARAWRALHDQLEGRPSPGRETLVPRLVVRGSTAPPPR